MAQKDLIETQAFRQMSNFPSLSEFFRSFPHPHSVYWENSRPADGRDPAACLMKKTAVGVIKNIPLSTDRILHRK
jgi:hypothetical protein